MWSIYLTVYYPIQNSLKIYTAKENRESHGDFHLPKDESCTNYLFNPSIGYLKISGHHTESTYQIVGFQLLDVIVGLAGCDKGISYYFIILCQTPNCLLICLVHIIGFASTASRI